MSPVVAVIAAGSMGAAVGKVLSGRGVTVLTSLQGRSAATAERARAAGITPADDREIAAADFILSIVPPGDAVSLAQRLTPILKDSNTKPVYVDCNAVSPQTVMRIAEAVGAARCPFVDVGIIGPPPAAGMRTVFYTSGPDASRFATLGDYGLKIELLDGPLSAASALKMSYGGITKGMTAIATAMILAAARGGSAKPLLKELQASFACMPWVTRQVPSMYHRAYRWVAEMEEVSDFAAQDPAARDMYQAIARLYEKIAQDHKGGGEQTAALSAFFEPDGK